MDGRTFSDLVEDDAFLFRYENRDRKTPLLRGELKLKPYAKADARTITGVPRNAM